MLQAVLAVSEFHGPIGSDERRALSPLFWAHRNLYGRFRPDMNTRLDLAGGANRAGVESVL